MTGTDHVMLREMPDPDDDCGGERDKETPEERLAVRHHYQLLTAAGRPVASFLGP